jgi:putative addiction module component (TIGR02574 family)
LELVPDEIDPAIDEAWREELRRRRAKIASGETKLLAWEDVREQLFAK